MKKLKLLLSLTATFVIVACQNTPQKITVDTLATVGLTANAAYDAYLQTVLQGTVQTNDVPTITHYYRDFQASFGVAVSAARFATNTTVANPELSNLLGKLTAAIATVKGK